MSKRITISDDEYFKLMELKARFKTDSLLTILAKLDNSQIAYKSDDAIKGNGQITNLAISQDFKETNKPTIRSLEDILPSGLCACGHPEHYHSADGCLGEGCCCECKEFKARTRAP